MTRIALTALSAVLLLATPASAADPAEVGRWSPLQTYPLTPISAAVTPDGNIVAWDQADPNPKHSISPNNGRAIVIDPDVGVVARSANLAPTSVFCPLITTLPDGKVAIVGGGNDSGNSDRTVVFDPETRRFGAWGSMSRGRWYGGGNIDSRSNIIALGGRGGSGADVIDAASGLHRRLGVGFGDSWYPHLLRAPDGRFLVENISQVNTPSRQWLTTAGNGTLTNVADRSLLESRRRLTTTMVGPYTMLMITGGTTRTAYLLDVATGQVQARTTGTLKFPHMTGTAATLPDGSALVIGGNSSNHETQGTPVMTPELWSPSTGQWTSMADSPRRRLYHSVAALLPDGRVWSAGTSAFGHDEYNGAYFEPPYLFKRDGSGQPAPRPQVAGAPASVAWGERFTVRSPQAGSIRRAALIRLAATTHQYAFDQTYVPLDVTRSGDELAMTVPANGNTIPAGQYMLFLVDEDGVPSKAPTIEVKPEAAAQPAAVTTQSTQYISAWGQAGKAFDGDMRNAVNGTWNGNHTNLETEPWIEVDLGRSRSLDGVRLFNRTDRYGTRLRSAWVFASDTPITSTSVAGARAQNGVTAVQITGSPGATVDVPLNRTARYLRVQLPRTDYLHLREIEPRFSAAPPPPPPPAPALAATVTGTTDTHAFVRVTNTGDAAGAISGLTLPAGGWSHDWGPAPPFSVAPGGEETLAFARGTADGDLVLAQDGGRPALRVALTGVKPEPLPPVLALAKTGETDSQVTVRVTNSGGGDGTIQSVTLPGAGWAQTAGPGAPFTVPAGGERTLTLARGSVSGDLVLAPSSGPALTLALTKAPEPTGTAAFTVSPTSLSFGARYRRAGSVESTTIRNTGTAAGVPGPIALVPNSTSFGIIGSTCGSVAGDGGSVTGIVSLAPGAACTVTIGYRGMSLFGASATLTAAGTAVSLSGSTRLF